MTVKKTNALFLTIVVINLLLVFAMIFYYLLFPNEPLPDFQTNILLSEGIMFVPALLLLFVMKGQDKVNDLLGFHTVHLSTVALTILFTILIMPLATLLNAISMLFVENVVSSYSEEMLEMPFWQVFLIVAVVGPFCEEVIFRGIIYHGYRKSRNLVLSVIFSALLFGLIHMNFNQALYAFGLGIMLALLCEATGSVWMTFLAHMIFNGENVAILFLEEKFFPEVYEQAQEMAFTQQDLLMTIGVYMIIALVGTTLAFLLVNKIAKDEQRYDFLSVVWGTRHNHAEKMVTWPLVMAIILCVAYMIVSTFAM
ncbi:MAG: CPBP family intramembrane metalloprotease [Lachnospiraceae bacterium]|nr:CPBP family intramembrane metalloprotease [Lachnospiraceae bacterium]